MKHRKFYPGLPNDSSAEFFVSTSRIDKISSTSSPNFDTKKLARLLVELNKSYQGNCFFSCMMIIRAIMDHVPPIFKKKTFGEVADNYSGSASFKKSMIHLDKSLRSIADSSLHRQIRSSESLPDKPQVEFRADVDVLLEEVVCLLQAQK